MNKKGKMIRKERRENRDNMHRLESRLTLERTIRSKYTQVLDDRSGNIMLR
jgi:hypothetical protein